MPFYSLVNGNPIDLSFNPIDDIFNVLVRISGKGKLTGRILVKRLQVLLNKPYDRIK